MTEHKSHKFFNTAERIVFRTSIKPELMRATLKRRVPLAALGALMIILGGSFMTLPLLKTWGIPLFFSALLLIAIGWLPYRRLQRLELKPDTLEYDGEYLLYIKGGQGLFKIPQKSLAQVDYVAKGSRYGVALSLKRPVEERVRVLQKGYRRGLANQFEECDLFLPYFTKRIAQEIIDLLESDRAF